LGVERGIERWPKVMIANVDPEQQGELVLYFNKKSAIMRYYVVVSILY
jgi:hypothetical protein